MKLKNKTSNILCLFGFHDWYIIKSKDTDDITADIAGIKSHVFNCCSGVLYKEKICLKCAKYVDEITLKRILLEKERKDEAKEIRQRKQLALKLLNERKK